MWYNRAMKNDEEQDTSELAICKDCKVPLIIELGDDGGCDEPGHCGGRNYQIDILCPSCHETEMIC